ncbi:MAG: energy-coupling factor ABC transporter permease [Thermoanaerobaculia bacterium]
MHIPDGFISPKVYIPAYVLSSGLWIYSIKKVKKILNEETLPFLSATSAFSFILMMVVVPLPGGTTAHGLGICPLAILFGPFISFLSISLVLLIQSLFFGNGGITTLPINSLAIGFFGSIIVFYFYKIFGKFKRLGAFLGSFFGVIFSSFLISIILGLQPIIAKDPQGKPLFFPFGFSVTIPALVIPHIFVGIAEGILTLIALEIVKKFDKGKIFERKD